MPNGRELKSGGIHWAWVILAVCFVNFFINYGIRLGYGVVLPEMIRTMGITRREGGDIFNSYLFAYICFSPFTGYLTDRLGARKIIPLFGIILGIGAILMGTSKTVGQASLFFALVGIGASAMWTPILTVVQRWFDIRRKGMALGILSTGFGLGFATTGQLFPLIVKHWNWQCCWYFLGTAALAMIFVNIALLRSKPEDKGLTPWGSPPDNNVKPTDNTPKPKSKEVKRQGIYKEVFVSPNFWLIGFSYFLISGTLYIITTYMVDYAHNQLGFPYSRASLLATIHGLSQIVGVIVIGILSDRIGRRFTILLSDIFIAIGTASIILSGRSEIWLFTSIAFIGAFYGATFPMYAATGGDYFKKENMGAVIGILTFFYGTGAIVSHRVAGHIRDVTGSFDIPFRIAFVLSILAATLIYFVKNTNTNKT